MFFDIIEIYRINGEYQLSRWWFGSEDNKTLAFLEKNMPELVAKLAEMGYVIESTVWQCDCKVCKRNPPITSTVYIEVKNENGLHMLVPFHFDEFLDYMWKDIKEIITNRVKGEKINLGDYPDLKAEAPQLAVALTFDVNVVTYDEDGAIVVGVEHPLADSDYLPPVMHLKEFIEFLKSRMN